MGSMVTEEVRAKAEVHYGDDLGLQKTKLLLQEVGLPRGLLPLKDIIECGYVEETGFVWVKQKKKVDHCFDKIGKVASYGPEITAYVEKLRIRKLTGVKVKELMIWLTLSDIHADAPAPGKVTFKTSTGLFRVFPAFAFELHGDLPKLQEKPQLPAENQNQKKQEEKQNLEAA